MRSRLTPAYLKQLLRRMLYLVLALPLGLAYFAALVALIGVGVPLLIVWLGVPILALTLALWWYLARMERRLVNYLLDAGIPPMTRPAATGATLWQRVRAHLGRGITWTSLVYLLILFPFGVVSCFATLMLVAAGLNFLTAPLHAPWSQTMVTFPSGSTRTMDTFQEGLLLAPFGLALLLLTVPVVNGLALAWRAFARLMLTAREAPVESREPAEAATVLVLAPLAAQRGVPALAAGRAQGQRGPAAATRPAQVAAFPPAQALTEREAEVLALLAAGASNREIADQLFVSEGTVKRHTHNIYRKLDVNNRTQAAVRAGELGLLNP